MARCGSLAIVLQYSVRRRQTIKGDWAISAGREPVRGAALP